MKSQIILGVKVVQENDNATNFLVVLLNHALTLIPLVKSINQNIII
jgi:hypothetical protein